MTILTASIMLFLVLDPIGNIPLFLFALKDVPQERYIPIIIREAFIGLGFLCIFLFSGKYILILLHVSQSSLSIAGGIILFLIAIKMVFSKSDELFDIKVEGEPFIVPLAIPLMAGPSALATVLLMMARNPERWPHWLAAVILAWSASLLILLLSKFLKRVFKQRGLTALERLMGLILTAVSVEMLVTGIQSSFNISP